MVLLAVVVLAHLALPWSLGPTSGFLGRSRATAARRIADEVRLSPVRSYGYVTIGLAAIALIITPLDGRIPWLGEYPVVVLAALAAGCGFPLLAARLARRPRRPFSRRPPAAELVMLPFAAAAEEVLWRAAAFVLLASTGLPVPLAAALAVLGFASLHIPYGGWRPVPYLLGFGVLLTVLALTGGLAAAVCCHFAHNLVLATTERPKAPASTAVAPPLPPSRSWG